MSETVEELDRLIQELIHKRQLVSDAQNLASDVPYQSAASPTSGGKTNSQRQTQQTPHAHRDQRKSGKLSFDLLAI